MGSLSIAHWGLLLVAAFLLIGRSRFSAVMGGLGEGLKNFRKGLSETSSAMDFDKVTDQAEAERRSSGI